MIEAICGKPDNELPDIAALIRATAYRDVNRTQDKLPDRLRTERYAVDLLEGILRLVGLLLGWPLRVFRRWLDRQPNRDPSQISSLEKLGRLMLGITLTLGVLIPLGWLIFK